MLAAACLLSACSSVETPYIDTAKALLGGSAKLEESQLNPDYRHLQLTLSVTGSTAFVTLGDIDNLPAGPVEIYYGGGGIVMRLLHGRLYGVNGLPVEWRDVTIDNAPSWATAARQQRTQWSRTRDMMPGYRYGIHEKIELVAVAPPRKNPVQQAGGELTWFEERVVESDLGSPRDRLPPARYAVSLAGGEETVVYAEQCLAPEVCLTWQTWPAGKR